MSDGGGIARSARVIAVLTMASRVLGLVREVMFGALFGTSSLLSAFSIAWMLPNLARRLFGEGALSAATVPILSETLRSEGVDAARRFVGALLVGLTLFLSAAVVLAEFAVLIALQFTDDPTLRLSQILLPYAVLICLVAITGGVLNVYGYFALPAAVPVVMNLALILGTGAGALLYPADSLSLMNVICGFALLSGVGQFGMVWWGLARAGRTPLPSMPWTDQRIGRVLLLMGPMVLGLSAVPLNTLADYLIAYLFVVEDSARPGPAILRYAQYLYQLPLGVFGIAIATAAFPALSARAAAGERVGVGRSLNRGLRLGLFVSLPASVGLVVVAEPIVATLLERGKFGSEQSVRVAAVLALYSLALSANFAQHLVVRTFYALKRTGEPARIALTMVGLNLLLNLILVFPMKERGLALASAVCGWVQLAWLGLCLKRVLPEWSPGLLLRPSLQALTASAAMAVVVGQLVRIPIPDWFFDPAGAVSLTAYVVAGALTFGAAAKLIGADELNAALSARRKTDA